jgi:hypothetical protein
MAFVDAGVDGDVELLSEEEEEPARRHSIDSPAPFWHLNVLHRAYSSVG